MSNQSRSRNAAGTCCEERAPPRRLGGTRGNLDVTHCKQEIELGTLMTKIRVFELARELKVESKILLTKLKAAGFDLPSHQSSLTPEQVELIKSGKLGTGAVSTPEVAKLSAKPTVVLRRRRPQAAEQETTEQTEEQEASSDQSLTEDFEIEAVIEPPTNEEHEDVFESASGSEVKTLPKDELAASSSVEKTEDESSTGPIETAAAPKMTPEVQTRQSTVARGRPQAEKAGATIVRKASPADAQPPVPRPRETPRGRYPTSRPQPDVRVGDKRPEFRSERADPFGPRTIRTDKAPDIAPPPAPDEWEGGRTRRRDPKDIRRKTDEEELQQRKALAKKREEGAFNARAILSHLELKSVDAIEEELVVLDDTFQRRTVYTPSASNKRKDIKRRKDLKKTLITTPRASYRVVKMLGPTITVAELSKQLTIKASELIKKLMAQGIMVTINATVDTETAVLVAGEYGFEVQMAQRTVENIIGTRADENIELPTESRPPIVTVMGHVDHGKTSILDAIRKTNIADGEAGGITQHIGAYTINHAGKPITFLDTPGHEAFSSMRARGAKLTDIVVLVVAADDGVKKQTIEAISHAKEAEVPVIVAINKIDKPNINLDKVYKELSEQGVQPEEWGGEIQVVKVSALAKIGLDELLEAILLQAEMLELRAAPWAKAEGVVIEAHLDKGRGPIATVMVTNGTLKAGDFIVAGTQTGYVRAMYDHLGNVVEEVFPSIPVQVLGLSAVPDAGDQIHAVDDEKVGREVVEFRLEEVRKANSAKSSSASLQDLLGKIRASEMMEVPIILKADAQGSVEAIGDALTKLNTEKVSNRIIHRGVGGVTESDIALAAASKGVIVAFNVRAGRGLDEHAEEQGVPVKYFSIIYDVVDAIKSLMAGKLPPIVKEVILGHAEVRLPISVPKIGTIAGSAVTDGKITRTAHCRLVRDSVVIYNGRVGSLRRFKDDVREVLSGYECGIGIEGYNDVHEGDVIEAYVLEETASTL